MMKYAALVLFLLLVNLSGQTNKYISNIDNLKSAINSASPGDTITVVNGLYDSEGSITITNSGEENKIIIIQAEEIGGVELSGETYFDFRKCSYIEVKGFNFTSLNVTAIKLQASNNIRITRNRFAIKETESVKWILVGGIWDDPNALSHHNRIDHNLFENKTYPGNFITIDGTPDPTYISSQYDRIDHNHFKFNTPRAENEKESIRVGWSELSQSSGFTVVEYNLFEECDGDPEIISVKTCDDTVRYNTFVGCVGTVSLRHGNRSSVYGNFFLGYNKTGTGGIRIYGDDHKIYNNYFEGLTGTVWDAPITLTNGDADISSSLAKHFRINRAIIVHNTLVNNSHNIEIGYTNNGKYSKPPKEVTIADNIIAANENEIVKIISNPIDFVWANNLFYTSSSAEIGTDLDSKAYWNEDPILTKDIYYKQTQLSPTINKATNDYDFANFDIELQSRDSLFDVGADEFSNDLVKNKPLTDLDVGPFADINLTDIQHKKSSFILHNFKLFQNYPNPFNPTTNISVSIPKSGIYKLKIYNILGQEVASLLNKQINAGNYTFNFDASNLTSGIYFYKFTSKNFSHTKKMILIN